jgi:hypothetical protein
MPLRHKPALVALVLTVTLYNPQMRDWENVLAYFEQPRKERKIAALNKAWRTCRLWSEKQRVNPHKMWRVAGCFTHYPNHNMKPSLPLERVLNSFELGYGGRNICNMNSLSRQQRKLRMSSIGGGVVVVVWCPFVTFIHYSIKALFSCYAQTTGQIAARLPAYAERTSIVTFERLHWMSTNECTGDRWWWWWWCVLPFVTSTTPPSRQYSPTTRKHRDKYSSSLPRIRWRS